MKPEPRTSGQASIEFALTSVIIFTAFLFVLDGSRIFFNYITVTETARVGARYAVLHGTNSTAPIGPGNYAALTQQVQSAAVGLNSANLTVTPTWTPNNKPGSSVTVNITYRVQPVTSMFWQGQTFTLRSQSTMVIQN